MLAAERMERIVEIVNQREIVTIDELMETTGGSRATVRRDINRLAADGRLRKTHGGVVSVFLGTSGEPSVNAKRGMRVEEKRRIAAAALAHMEDNDFVFLDSGTTTLELARILDGRKRLTVVAADLFVATEAAKRPGVKVVTPGGAVRRDYFSFYGHFAEETIRNLRADRAFLSVDSVTVESGLMNYTLDEVAVKRLFVQQSGEIILLCDHTKFEARCHVKICELTKVSRVITDKGLSLDIAGQIEEAGVAIELV